MLCLEGAQAGLSWITILRKRATYAKAFDGFDVASRICLHHAAPKVVLTSSRDPREFGPLVGRSGAKGFVPKGELSAARICALL